MGLSSRQGGVEFPDIKGGSIWMANSFWGTGFVS